jgi:HAD superfamily hydrolase (TIGR01549 family)
MSARAFIFDLDGTLIHSPLDFDVMRRAIGAPRGVDILDFILALPPDEAVVAYTTVVRMESEAAGDLRLIAGFDALMDGLDAAALPRAIVTRNNADTLAAFLAHTGRAFSPALDRGFGPPKPHPAALLHVMEAWGLPAEHVWMVGDGDHDHDAARAAGCRFALVRQPYNQALEPRADLVVDALDALLQLI